MKTILRNPLFKWYFNKQVNAGHEVGHSMVYAREIPHEYLLKIFEPFRENKINPDLPESINAHIAVEAMWSSDLGVFFTNYFYDTLTESKSDAIPTEIVTILSLLEEENFKEENRFIKILLFLCAVDTGKENLITEIQEKDSMIVADSIRALFSENKNADFLSKMIDTIKVDNKKLIEILKTSKVGEGTGFDLVLKKNDRDMIAFLKTKIAEYESPIVKAIEKNDAKEVQKLLDEDKKQANAKNLFGESVLTLAIRQYEKNRHGSKDEEKKEKDITMIKILLSNGADPNVLDDNSLKTPLIYAILSNNNNFSEFLLSNSRIQPFYHFDLLHHSSQKKIFDYLLRPYVDKFEREFQDIYQKALEVHKISFLFFSVAPYASNIEELSRAIFEIMKNGKSTTLDRLIKTAISDRRGSQNFDIFYKEYLSKTIEILYAKPQEERLIKEETIFLSAYEHRIEELNKAINELEKKRIFFIEQNNKFNEMLDTRFESVLTSALTKRSRWINELKNAKQELKKTNSQQEKITILKSTVQKIKSKQFGQNSQSASQLQKMINDFTPLEEKLKNNVELDQLRTELDSMLKEKEELNKFRADIAKKYHPDKKTSEFFKDKKSKNDPVYPETPVVQLHRWRRRGS